MISRFLKRMGFIHPGWSVVGLFAGMLLSIPTVEIMSGLTIHPAGTPLELLVLCWTYGLGAAARDVVHPRPEPASYWPFLTAVTGAIAMSALGLVSLRPSGFNLLAGAIAFGGLGATAVTIWQAAWGLGTFARAEEMKRGRSDLLNALLLFLWPVGAWYFWPLTTRIRQRIEGTDNAPSMQG